ncbi:hypothetical protein [Krasilnikovia sp. M28-CT-15]|uniref:hypothetical protein n=1 Tax=Krasilnikovia sp. M28-CT-15 TaxID=3373540 RepID=UPI00387685ED
MKTKLPGIVTVVGTTLAALAASFCAPVAASAATAPPVPKGVSYISLDRQLYNYRTGQYNNTNGYLGFRYVANADRYEVTVANGATKRVFNVTAKAGSTSDAITVQLDKCTNYMASVKSLNSLGQGTASRPSLWPSQLPGGIRAASAKRGTDPTTATFTWTAPSWLGYASDKFGNMVPIDATHMDGVMFELQLVRMSDNRVVQEDLAYAGSTTQKINYTVSGLTAKGAYVLRVKSTNRGGGCDNKIGKILLNKVK